MSHIAHLTPNKREAREAFNDVAAWLKVKPENNELQYAARFMVIEPYRQVHQNSQISLKNDVTKETEVDTATDTEAEIDLKIPPIDLKFEGHFIISFEIRPMYPLVGSVIGTGRWQGKGSKPNGAVDLQLALPRTPFSQYEVTGRHARIVFDETVSLVIGVVSDRSPRIVLGTQEFSSGQRAITERRSLVSFGKLSYVFEYVINDEEEYQRNLGIYFGTYLFRDPPAPDLSATPSP